MDYKLELGKLLKHCIEEANKRKGATAALNRGVRMAYQNVRFAIDEIFERAQAEADTGENNALLPDVRTRTWEFSYDEDFRDIEMTIDVPDNKDPYDLLEEQVGENIALCFWYRVR